MSSKKKGSAQNNEEPAVNEEPVVNEEQQAEEVKAADAGTEVPSAEAAVQNNGKLQAELTAEKDKYLRLLAEYDNYRKRSAKEREALFSDIRSDTVSKFLPVYDNLERALRQGTEDEAFLKGVEMIMTQFREVFNALGVSEIPALGEKFDPAIHNAVMHIDDEEKGENEIVEEFQKGFKLGDKVIRFSMVKVAN